MLSKTGICLALGIIEFQTLVRSKWEGLPYQLDPIRVYSYLSTNNAKSSVFFGFEVGLWPIFNPSEKTAGKSLISQKEWWITKWKCSWCCERLCWSLAHFNLQVRRIEYCLRTGNSDSDEMGTKSWIIDCSVIGYLMKGSKLSGGRNQTNIDTYHKDVVTYWIYFSLFLVTFRTGLNVESQWKIGSLANPGIGIKLLKVPYAGQFVLFCTFFLGKQSKPGARTRPRKWGATTCENWDRLICRHWLLKASLTPLLKSMPREQSKKKLFVTPLQKPSLKEKVA